MKKFLKKSLSIVLAVLMVMTAWVFVAPEDNQAEATAAGSYYYKVAVASDNDTGGWDKYTWTLYGKPTNGTGSETSITTKSEKIDYDTGGTSESKASHTVMSDSSANFPTKVTFVYSFGGGVTHRKMNAYCYLYVSSNNSTWTLIGSAQFYSYEWGTNSGTKTLTVDSSKYPYASTMTASYASSSLSCPKPGAANVTNKLTYGATDQYGVTMASSLCSVSVKGAKSGTTGISTTTGNGSDNTTVTSAANIAGTTNSQTVTATCSWGGSATKTKTATFTLNDCKLTPKFTIKNAGLNTTGATTTTNGTDTYYGCTPTAPSTPGTYWDSTNHYTFSSWSPTIGAITADTTYTAQYTTTAHTYTYSGTNGSSTHTATCSVCGYSKTEDCSGGTATCTELATCSKCGTTYGSLKAHTAGTAVKENEVAATCTTAGSYDSVVYCTVCGTEMSRTTTTVPAKGHTAAAAVKENVVGTSCTEPGSYDSVVYCSVCGTELSRESMTVDALGHSFTNYVYNNDATCTSAGTKTAKCDRCDATDTITDSNHPALGHTAGTAVKENEVAATCTETGSYESVVYCSVCGVEISRDTVTVDALGHSFTNYVYNNDATCTTDGTKTAKCDRCDATDTITDSDHPALGHTAGTAVTENNVNPTCTVDGSFDTVVYCSVCGTELSRTSNTVPALGHDYTSSVTAPTCTEKGYTTYTCSRCDDSYKDDYTDAIGHNFTGEAKANSDGTHSYLCANGCGVYGNVDSDGNQVADGSEDCSYVASVTAEPTCTTKGVRTYTCSVCGNSYTEDIDTVAHTYSTVFYPATCTTAGYYAATCSVCGHQENIDYFEASEKSDAAYPDSTQGTYADNRTIDYSFSSSEIPADKVSKMVITIDCQIQRWTVLWLNYNSVLTVSSGDETLYTIDTSSEDSKAGGYHYNFTVEVPSNEFSINCTNLSNSASNGYYFTVTNIEVYPSYPALGHDDSGETVKENYVAPTYDTDGSYDNVLYCAREGCGAELSRETVTVNKLKKYIELPDTNLIADFSVASSYTIKPTTADGITYSFIGIVDQPSDRNQVLDSAPTAADTSAGKYGTLKIANDGTAEYTVSTVNFSGNDTYWLVVSVKGATGYSDTVYTYQKLEIVPATSVYYEDSFAESTDKGFTYTDSENASGNYGVWKTVGSGSASSVLADLNSNGYTSAYDSYSTYSGNSAHMVSVSSANKGSWPKMNFSFTGTGFDLISVTSGDSGIFTVTISQNGTILKKKIVDTYYGYKYSRLYLDGTAICDSETNTTGAETKTLYMADTTKAYVNETTLADGCYADNNNHIYTTDTSLAKQKDGTAELAYGWVADSTKSATYYQIPVISMTDLDYGSYDVTIEARFTKSYGHYLTDGDTNYFNLYVDGIRVYNPAKGNTVCEEAYDAAGVNNATYTKFRDYVTSADMLVIEGGDEIADSADLSELLAISPKNEVYLKSGSTITFDVETTNLADLLIGIKSVNGTGCSVTVSYGTTSKTIQVNSATEMYYSLLKQLGVSSLDGTVTITNNGSGILSLTSLKATSSEQSGESVSNNASNPVSVSKATAVNAIALLSMTEADLTINEDDVETATNDGTVTMTIKTSTDVSTLLIKDENGNTVTPEDISVEEIDGVESWTVVLAESNSGTYTYYIQGQYENGYTGDNEATAVTVTVDVPEATDETETTEEESGFLTNTIFGKYFSKLLELIRFIINLFE